MRHLLQHAIRTSRYLPTREIVGDPVSSLDSMGILVLEALQDDSCVRLVLLVPQQESHWDNRSLGAFSPRDWSPCIIFSPGNLPGNQCFPFGLSEGFLFIRAQTTFHYSLKDFLFGDLSKMNFFCLRLLGLRLSVNLTSWKPIQASIVFIRNSTCSSDCLLQMSSFSCPVGIAFLFRSGGTVDNFMVGIQDIWVDRRQHVPNLLLLLTDLEVHRLIAKSSRLSRRFCPKSRG